MATVLQRVTTVLGDRLGIQAQEVTVDARFDEDLHCDSLDRIELSLALEEEFGVEIPDADAEALETVGAVVDYLEREGERR